MSNTIVACALNGAERIKQPGKFEGEPIWAPVFWDRVLGGEADDVSVNEETTYAVITVTDEDIAAYPALRNIHSIWLWKTDQGFVNSGLCASGYNECCGCSELVIDTLFCEDCIAGKDDDDDDDDESEQS